MLARAALLLLAVAACGCDGAGSAGAPPPPPEPVDTAPPVWDVPLDDPRLEEGRLVWRETCRPCHGTGLAGAPRIGDRQAWAPRLAKGTDVLVEHALGGFEGPAGTQMPARGGRADLSDDAIRKAVEFVTSRSR
jgi:cytochrome c5